MNHIHILQVGSVPRPWWPTEQRCEEVAGHKVWTDCCSCKLPAEQTDSRYVETWDYPLGDMGGEFIWGGDWEEQESPTAIYFDGRVETRCSDGFGCTVNPRKKSGRSLREYWRFG